MRPPLALAFALAVIAAVIGADVSRAGQVPAVSGTFTMTSDPGDYIGDGRSYSFPTRAIRFGVTSWGEVRVSALTDGHWGLTMSAPDRARLQPRVYANAQRHEDAVHPGLDVGGDGRGCNATTGRFTVLDVGYGPRGYLRSLHATFVQRCEGNPAAALRGELNLVAAAPPPLVKVGVTLDPSSTSIATDRSVMVVGTIACSKPVSATVNAEVRESGEPAGSGSGGVSVECSSKPTSWAARASSLNGISFTGGELQLAAQAQATDTWYTAYFDNESQIVASNRVSGDVTVEELPEETVAEETTPEQAGIDEDSSRPTWTAFVVLAVVAAVGWTFLVALAIVAVLTRRGRQAQ